MRKRQAVMHTVSKRLKQAREKVGFTQGELAEKAQVVKGYVSMLERGQRMPHLDVIDRLAKAMDVPVVYFFSDDTPAEPQLESGLYGPLMEFARRRSLTKEQVDHLIEIGKTVFKQ